MDQDFYFNFEKKFRGSRESIINRISIYDSLIQLIIEKNQENKFLDIGSGRGEWLQKWDNKVSSCIGVEVDLNMINYCLNKGFEVLQGDAIKTLSNIETESISVITIFHTIEHLDNKYLNQLMTACYRVLDKNGLLIIETPSIDNILVSTKSFYIDPTHVNHIHPDGLSFLIEQKGFSKAAYFYINEGPLSTDSSTKMTKILNGVAQDIAFVVTKSEKTSQLIFEKQTEWQKYFKIALSTMDAAIAYDLENEKIISELNKKYIQILEDLDDYKLEINFLKKQLKHLILGIRVTKKLLSPFLFLIRKIKKIVMYWLNQAFNFSFKFRIVRKILNSDEFLNSVSYFLKKTVGASSNSIIIKIKNNIKKCSKNDSKSNGFNNLLRVHYRNSKMSRFYFSLLNKHKDK